MHQNSLLSPSNILLVLKKRYSSAFLSFHIRPGQKILAPWHLYFFSWIVGQHPFLKINCEVEN